MIRIPLWGVVLGVHRWRSDHGSRSAEGERGQACLRQDSPGEAADTTSQGKCFGCMYSQCRATTACTYPGEILCHDSVWNASEAFQQPKLNCSRGNYAKVWSEWTLYASYITVFPNQCIFRCVRYSPARIEGMFIW